MLGSLFVGYNAVAAAPIVLMIKNGKDKLVPGREASTIDAGMACQDRGQIVPFFRK